MADVGTDELLEAVVALADGADKCMEAPHFIVQPFLGIYAKHGETITRARLLRSRAATRGTEVPNE